MELLVLNAVTDLVGPLGGVDERLERGEAEDEFAVGCGGRGSGEQDEQPGDDQRR